MAVIGTYNPNQPEILGEEWVPIREEGLVFNQVVNNVEIGTTFSAGDNVSLTGPGSSGRFYINTLPSSLVRNQCWTMAIYNRGEEALSGPIRRVLVPVASGTITGSSSAIVLRNAANLQTALFDPSDRRYLEMTLGNSLAFGFDLYFDISKFGQALAGKRILGVNFLYSGELLSQGSEAGQLEALQFSLQDIVSGTNAIAYPALIKGTTSALGGVSPFRNKEVTRIAIGDTNMFFNPTTGLNITEAVPWAYSNSGLLRFDPTNSNPVAFHFFTIGTGSAGPNWTLDWVNLEILYCEETRLAVGTSVFQYGAAATTQNYRLGYNSVNFYAPGGGNAPSINVGGDYTMTIAQGSLGDSPLAFSLQPIGAQPELNALRELYQVQPQTGVQVNIPAPPSEDIVGEVLTVEETSILPQLSLHQPSSLSSVTFPSTHSYGRQSVAQVYGAKTASQRIDDSQNTANNYSKVRFYARRFGNTIIPLTLTGPGTSTFINPDDFDDLDPIIDGWKEITLPLDPPAVMGSTGNPTWTWTATQETAGNRWEVLGAVALAQDGVVGQPTTQLTTLDVTTYGAPISGGQILETWMPQSLPPVSGSTVDTTADAAIYFSWTPPAITGMTVQTMNQALSGIGMNCGVPPEFIPSALQYNRITWSPNPSYYVYDNFNRTSASSWGTATSGQNWSAASAIGTSPGYGFGSGGSFPENPGGNPVINRTRFVAYDTKGFVEVANTIAPSGASYAAGVELRVEGTGGTNLISVLVYFNSDNTLNLGIKEYGATSVTTNISAGPKVTGYTLGTKVNLRWQFIGQELLARIWLYGAEEPGDWQMRRIIYGSNTTVRRSFGAFGWWPTGTPAPVYRWSNLLVANATNGYVELQRRDTITDWQTIMKGTWMAASGFNDYEARIGLLTDYRIRYVNRYGFEGPWSSTVSNTIPAPGVTATNLGADDEVFVFTTNEHQDGSSNLAYSPAWTGSVREDFAFPEASGQVYQTMYGRDFVTVFRPEERGGTNFTRNVLVQAAAISPPTLEDFTSLRDMAWADVSYICVRDADGNRWLSNVSVPSGTVSHYRKLYIAPISVVQVTDTPSPVDPSWLD